MTQQIEPDDFTEPDTDDAAQPQEPSQPTEAPQEEELPFEEPAEPEHVAGEPTEPPKPQGITPEQWEKRFQKAERRFESYRKAVQAIWEEDAIHLTPIAVGAMAPPGFIDVREAGRVPDEVKNAVLTFYGFAREQEYDPDPETKTCDACSGKGKTKTGSTVPEYQTRTCPRCKGWGYIAPAATNGAPDSNYGKIAPSTAHADFTDLPEQDNWGQPRILPDGRPNPNYGDKNPAYWVDVPPWGDTRNLPLQSEA